MAAARRRSCVYTEPPDGVKSITCISALASELRYSVLKTVSSCLNLSSHSLSPSGPFSEVDVKVLALRQPILKRKTATAKLNALDRLFWTALRHCWSRWSEVLVIVQPETVIALHRAGFRLYWRWRSRPRGGRPKITEEIRVLIRRLAQDNQHWGAPKIHGELQKLGFVLSERSVARYLRGIRRRSDPGKQLADVPAESSRGDRRLRFLHSADGNIPTALLVFRN